MVCKLIVLFFSFPAWQYHQNNGILNFGSLCLASEPIEMTWPNSLQQVKVEKIQSNVCLQLKMITYFTDMDFGVLNLPFLNLLLCNSIDIYKKKLLYFLNFSICTCE